MDPILELARRVQPASSSRMPARPTAPSTSRDGAAAGARPGRWARPRRSASIPARTWAPAAKRAPSRPTTSEIARTLPDAARPRPVEKVLPRHRGVQRPARCDPGRVPAREASPSRDVERAAPRARGARTASSCPARRTRDPPARAALVAAGLPPLCRAGRGSGPRAGAPDRRGHRDRHPLSGAAASLPGVRATWASARAISPSPSRPPPRSCRCRCSPGSRSTVSGASPPSCCRSTSRATRVSSPAAASWSARPMKIVSIVGARPQFVKAAAVSRTLRERHTRGPGAHRAALRLRDVGDLLRRPRDSGAGRESRGRLRLARRADRRDAARRSKTCCSPSARTGCWSTATRTRRWPARWPPSKLFVPVAHVEAGLRSFNRRMPEEINRVVADHLSDLLLCPSDTAVAQPGRRRHHARTSIVVGDVMLDVLNWATERAPARPPEVLHAPRAATKPLSCWRPSTAARTPTIRARLARILRALNALDEPVVFPVHPRTRKAIERIGLAARSLTSS